MITDRDIVTNCVANGGDPNNVMVEEYAAGEAVTIGADDSVEEALRTMTEHGVRRLPVIDGQELVGILSQADIARNLSPRPGRSSPRVDLGRSCQLENRSRRGQDAQRSALLESILCIPAPPWLLSSPFIQEMTRNTTRTAKIAPMTVRAKP